MKIMNVKFGIFQQKKGRKRMEGIEPILENMMRPLL